MANGWPRKTLDDVVAQIYLATTEPEHWNSVLETIGRRLGANIAAVHVHAQAGDVEPATTVGAWQAGGRPPGIRRYETYFAARNVWMQHGAHLLKPGAVLTGEEMCPDEILLRSEFYLDFLVALDVRYSIRAVLTSDPGPLSYFSAGRTQRAGRFGDPQRAILRAVTPHLMQAVRIQSRLESIQAGRHAFSGALERLPLAIIFLDRRCRVVEMNSTARRLVEAGDGMKLERGVLVAFDTRAEVQLQQMIFGAAEVDSGRFLVHGGALSLPRPEGRPPLSAMVAPTGVTGIFPASRSACVVVLVEEPARGPSAPLQAFARSHRLSRAEAGLAARLVGGMSLGQAAAALGIKDNTARSHLKRIFAKTGARRQADLVRRVLTYDGPKMSQTHPFGG
jgi:DNA-binding CsgD family transcriptional regulator/PAS domain-containing protein